MQGRNKQRKNDFGAIHLFLGLLLGFFLGSTVVYLQFNRQNDRIIKEVTEKIIAIFSDNSSDTRPAAPHESKIDESADDNSESSKSGSHNLSANAITGFNEHEIYSLARDKLIHSRLVSLSLPNNSKSESGRMLDSLIGNTTSTSREQVFYVEFWESPLNSVGYKMSKTRIVFYGIKIYELAEINHHREKFYLRYMNELYPLEFTNTFKPLIPQSTTIPFEEIQEL